MGYLFESAALGYLFLKKENREEFGTKFPKIDFKEVKKCLAIGIPPGLSYALEIFGWAVFYWIMTDLGEKHITIASVCQSFTILLSFFHDGLSRGAAAVTGNLIGSKLYEQVKKVLRSGFYLLFFFSIATALIFVVEPIDTVQVLFIEHPAPLMQSSLKTCMIYAFIYLFFEGLRWLLSGILLAAGDTMFLLIAGILTVWGFLLAPIYFIVLKNQLSIKTAMGLTVVYAALSLLIYYIRFKQGAWQKIDLVNQSKFIEEQPARNLEDKKL